MQITFKGWLCELVIGNYSNGRNGLELFDVAEGDPVATATINVPDHDMAEDEVAIKNYSENEGMLQTLMDAGVISAPVRTLSQGFVQIPICKLLITA